MEKEGSSSNTRTLPPKTAEQANTTYLERRRLVSDLNINCWTLLDLANKASAVFWGDEYLPVKVASQVEEAKYPCREERRFEKKYVRRKKSKEEHMESDMWQAQHPPVLYQYARRKGKTHEGTSRTGREDVDDTI
ncbi:unnamed protein product [Eruca vesicaria subsp. sativa]|uniref:Uncharacterized protein n=1 Tax=Eruca vesicaria subsp. sativa TaxID=29727 RepID=A0ABC8LGC3_ERUVS|nr:unnamed protein product [Eruca vesicaria subsp. sativa]